MNFEYGSTRFVFLLGTRAFKFGRVSLIRFVARILLFPFLGHQWKAPMGWALRHYLVGGIVCNQIEYDYYSRTRDLRVMPTRQIFFSGWLIIQDRGTPISEEEMLHEYPFDPVILFQGEIDANTAKQFARHRDGNILLVDYGTSQTCSMLEEVPVLSGRF